MNENTEICIFLNNLATTANYKYIVFDSTCDPESVCLFLSGTVSITLGCVLKYFKVIYK